ncbi:structural maintenance of chromosomes flexible hinge domain-containing protein GMI1 isoform X2 [Rhododendron vialii]|uniref:structural maintenance of chromosomes flexible hinge domain-containing protein GMI1 isoform X2 n=1 Tax=Rhododendron vialii TaxID=182163 RepID=UPI00265E7754|nr:structural maintenance of chromosomes flexible hinge domain-containing protein GMI1 isoform X2 [Rhododendron vialii]
MEAKKQEQRVAKRPYSIAFESKERPNKRPLGQCVKIEDGAEKIFKFRVLFPNGMSLGLKIRGLEAEWPMEEFVDFVKDEYFRAMRQTESEKPRRRIDWKSKDLHFVDAFDNVMRRRITFKNFKPNKIHILRLNDGSKAAETYENMWDLTPDTDLLMELPEEYNFETALADLIDNSLQAVWSNGVNDRRLVSVEVNKDRITIFDTGPGMDGSDENSIVKWGKMGASLHRSSRGRGIGGKPPYLMPVFGMFGYGGPIASMHLGRYGFMVENYHNFYYIILYRHCIVLDTTYFLAILLPLRRRALVSSKTKESKMVYTLHLEREALLRRSGSEKTWRTDGGIRHPTEDEISWSSPQGSFTKVEIFKPKMKDLDILQLQCKLKDIYFPYIQCDEVSKTRRTIMPVEFQVNGTDLAEIQGGEVAITNLHSCNGPEFVLQLCFSQDATSGPGVRVSQEANARLRFVYFPVVEGKENIERILENVKAGGCEIKENFESFSRVSIWRLGRLLPDARWKRLPFMEPRKKIGDKGQTLKICCSRVKCFIDTDAGFNPTPSKTDLAHHHPYTTVLRNFGDKRPETDKEVKLEISKDGKQVTLPQLEKQYDEWIFQMHDHYDEVIERGEDQPLLVVSPSNKKKLGISSDILRVHKEIQRKGASWKSGQKIKVLKGACAGCHKNNMYATLEYIVLEGFQGDSGGEARVICSPLGLPSENGCVLSVHDDGNAGIDIRSSISLPISVIDSGKCMAMEAAEWEYQVQKQRQKMPSTIELLSARHCQELEVDEPLPTTVYAGYAPPSEIVAVLRPASFNSASASKNLDQKHIVISKEDLEMCMQIKLRAADKSIKDIRHIYSGRIKPSPRKGFQGLYIFPVGRKLPGLFEKAGVYTFSFSLRELNIGSCERRVQVKPLSEVGGWRQSCDGQTRPYKVRVGLCFPPISIGCYDIHGNRIPFASVPEVSIRIVSGGGVLASVNTMKLDLSLDQLTLRIKDTLIECYKLDKIKPNYEATLVVSGQDELSSVSIPCQVLPGTFHSVRTLPRNLDKQLLPGHAIKELILEMFDAYGNHVDEGLEVQLNVDGFSFQDQIGATRKVDQCGYVDLSRVLKVTGGYGRRLSFSVLTSEKTIFKKEFETEKRELRILSEVPKFCMAGSILEDMVFEVINTEGDVDETIHDDESCGQSHMLMIKSEPLDTGDSVKYSFHRGCCIVRAISLRQKEGIVRLLAAHSRYPELHLTMEVHIMQAPKVAPEPIQTQYTDGKVFLLQDSSALVSSKELEKAVIEHGLQVGDCEMVLKDLNAHQVELKEELSILQASLGLDSSNHSGNATGKEAVMKQIESKGDSAAAVVCRLLREVPSSEQHNNVIENTLGVVALLGTVQTIELSRVLAEYLGEDQMLAIVCKSYAAVDALENYEQNGNMDHAHNPHPEAMKFAQSINGRYVVICLEDTRSYTGKLGSDPDRKLALPDPTLSDGNLPSGYLGYAVNLVNLESHHLQAWTNAGHSLRETLFYGLFGEIQVYETREHMKRAKPVIKQGAVSLDGGIMRGNGVLSFGHREPKICYAVIAPGSQSYSSPHNIEILRQIEEKKLKIKETLGQIKKGTKLHKKALKRFQKASDRYKLFLDRKGPLLAGFGDPDVNQL